MTTKTYERVREVAKRRGFNLVQVSEKAGIGERTIYFWKDHTPNIESLGKVAKVLNVSIDYLYGNTDEFKTSNMKPEKIKQVDLKKELNDEKTIVAFDGKPLSKRYLKILNNLFEEDDD